MAGLRDSLRRRTLWIGFIAVFLPLLLILFLQYWWLTRLEEASALAGRAILNNFLEAVTTEVLYFYGPPAERALDVPPAYFTQDRLDRAASHFRRTGAEGAKLLFVARFEHEEAGTILFYDPHVDAIAPANPSAETRAVTVACAPWRLMYDKGIEVEPGRLVVEERDPENRIILNPVLSTDSRIVGVAGMVLDADYFRTRLIPETIEAALPKFFAGSLPGAPVVTVRDRDGMVRFASGPADPPGPDEITRPFPFVFTDWRVGIRSRGRTPEQWARASFASNVTLSLMAAVLLMGGLVLVVRTASRAVTLSRMKSDFVSNVSHELRTPLASIRTFGELLRLGRASTPDKVSEYGEYIETESRRLTQLINNILDFAKIESGQKTYVFEVKDIGEVLAGTLKTSEVRLKHAGFTFDVQRRAGPLPPARVDADALGQAFHNLLDNAVLYSGDSRWIGVRLEHRDGEIVVSFEDHGIGISKDEQQKIFERFHRVSTGLVHEVHGTGLGLAIVQHIVSAHGGRVTVDSQPGRGSVFSIHLPAAEAGLGEDERAGGDESSAGVDLLQDEAARDRRRSVT